ncbi:alpha/beta hydrolase [Microbulbifer sp. OS29]|uniref:Alpha/beta hydrolase n=1 Tax=Microbulbifer okhotskensis TaxID=2926617 RepID=A0A9X2J8Y6_9GAMM|nr:alpha/beta hydrolase [Microbulbifer okhotskensis]MCO1336061.1 alpha/beta hydrolase [Microbulbifer okhotskensis]
MEFVTRGVTLHYRRWWVEGASAIVVVSHGLGEHSGRYSDLAADLNRAGYSVYALDHYGHGLSGGKRGHIEDFAFYSQDLHEFVALVNSGNPDIGVHLLGHSMGAVIACGCAIRFAAIDSLVLSAPGFRGKHEPSGLLLWLALQAARWFPRLVLSSQIKDQWVSRNPEIVAAFSNDKLVHHGISLRWFETFIREREFLFGRLGSLLMPCLMLLPETDHLVDESISRAWFLKIASKDKQLHCFPRSYHEVFNEVEEGRIARELLLSHLSSVPVERGAVAQG